MSNKLFLDDIKIVSQSVRRIVLTNDEFLLEDDLDYTSTNIDYKVFYNKEKELQHLIVMHFSIGEFFLVVEGIYEIKNNIKDEKEKNVIINYGSLNLLIDFLKTCIYSISSLTKSKPINIPLINLKELIQLSQKKSNETKEKSSKAKKRKETSNKKENNKNN